MNTQATSLLIAICLGGCSPVQPSSLSSYSPGNGFPLKSTQLRDLADQSTSVVFALTIRKLSIDFGMSGLCSREIALRALADLGVSEHVVNQGPYKPRIPKSFLIAVEPLIGPGMIEADFPPDSLLVEAPVKDSIPTFFLVFQFNENTSRYTILLTGESPKLLSR